MKSKYLPSFVKRRGRITKKQELNVSHLESYEVFGANDIHQAAKGFNSIYIEGIEDIELDDLNYAKELGYSIKHLAIGRKNNNGIELRVHACLIPEKRLLANVDGVRNAVVVSSDAAGPTLYYGAGAGSLATASSVTSDIIDVSRKILSTSNNSCLLYTSDAADE